MSANLCRFVFFVEELKIVFSTVNPFVLQMIFLR